MPKFGAQINTQRIPILGLIPEQAATASPPSSPVEGLFWYDSTLKVIKVWLNGAWSTLGSAGAGGPPSGTASGDLTGSYPGPTIAAGAVTTTKILDANVTIAKLAADTKDAAAGTSSLRKIGTGATDVVAGNDARLTDSRAPSGTATGDLAGSYPAPTIALLAVTAAKMANATITDTQVAAANKDGTTGVASMRTIGTGAQQAMAGSTRLDTIAAPTASVSLNTQKITGLLDGTAATDAVNKQQLDGAIQGLDAKQSVQAATTGTITLSGTQTVDGVALIAGNRCLVKDQSPGGTNGIYDVASGAWTRSTDLDLPAETSNAYVWVEGGTVNADTGWVQTATVVTLGTSPQTWTQFSGAGSFVAGAGLTSTGNTVNAIGTASRISVAADSIDIDSAYVGQASITTLGTVGTGTWNATTIAILKGGTGATDAATARSNLGAPGITKVAMPALSPGVWTTVPGAPDPTGGKIVAQFMESASPLQEVLLDYRQNTSGGGEFQVRADISYGAGALYGTIIQ